MIVLFARFFESKFVSANAQPAITVLGEGSKLDDHKT